MEDTVLLSHPWAPGQTLREMIWEVRIFLTHPPYEYQRAIEIYRLRSATPVETGNKPRRAVQRQVRLTEAQVAELVAAYKSGEAIKSLARRFEIHRSTVHVHLERRGVSRF